MAQPIWNTPAGSIGTFPATLSFTFSFSATPVLPAVNISNYTLISGSLPDNCTLANNGILSGTPDIVSIDTIYTFVIRATDNMNNIRDRTFSLTVTGAASPYFITPTGNILNTLDSTWVELPILYYNPITTNQVSIRLVQGILPPGLEINSRGIIRGYADKPVEQVNLSAVSTFATATNASGNIITSFTTTGFFPGRPIVFSGTTFGNILPNVRYYIKSVLSNTTFTITSVVDGDELPLSSATGYMTISLAATNIGEPTKINYQFTLQLESDLGNDLESYSIVVTNQNLSILNGGPGFLPGTRIPTIYNTRPSTYNIDDSVDYGYYLLPNNTGLTYPPSTAANMGTFTNDNFFSFQIIGHDFESDELIYNFIGLPLGLVGSSTGWITGTPIIAFDSISQYTFSVYVAKANNPSITSSVFNFKFTITNDIIGTIIWISPNNLGEINNGTKSTLKVLATCDVDLKYRIVGGTLPPNLSLLENGEIIGTVSFQPTSNLTLENQSNIFTVSIEAYSPLFPIITNTKTFRITVFQEFATPSDVLYMKATPSLEDRAIIDDLLTDNIVIPTDLLYRPDDGNFGKATSVVYAHAYGIDPESLPAYLVAVTRNHYWRNITLGEVEVALAKDEEGNVIYEAVYSRVINNLVNPSGVSIPQTITWPRPIDLQLGPWYGSSTNIYTSWATINGVNFSTSLTPGYATVLYPNSLVDMRNRVSQVIGSQTNYKLLPKWMTSQQANGSTLGFTPAWVICYAKPGSGETIKNNINTLWTNPYGEVYKLNKINFQLDRFTVDKSLSFNYDENLLPNTWLQLPGATPPPNPIDSKNFYVIFPRKTILPDVPQQY